MDDRALVAALVAGDQRGLDGTYRRYADRLFNYCRTLLRDPEAAADAVHDTFVVASQRAHQLRDPERLRPWLYAIARHECHRLLRARSRQVPLTETAEPSAIELTVAESDPAAEVARAEVRALVWAAAESLTERDREVFELLVRHDLPVIEVSSVLGISVAHAHARLSRARSALARGLAALLVARAGTGDCAALADLLAGWDGRLTALIRKRVSRHIEDCDICTEQRRRQLTPAALLSAYAGLPWLVVPAELWPRLEATCFSPGSATDRKVIGQRVLSPRPDGFPRPSQLRRRRLMEAVVAVVAVLGVAATMAVVAGAGRTASPTAGVAGSSPVTAAASATAPVPPGASISPAAAPSTSAGPAVPAAPAAPPAAPTAPPAAPTAPPAAPTAPPAAPTAAPTPASPSSAGPTGARPELAVEADTEVRCDGGIYWIEITVTGTEPLGSATAWVRAGDTAATEWHMARSGPQAWAAAGPLRATPVVWWVEVTTMDGRAAQTAPVEISGPCR